MLLIPDGPKLDELISSVRGVESAILGNALIRTWAEMQSRTRAGTISKFLAPADQLNVSESALVTASVSGEGVTAASVSRDTFLEAVDDVQGTYEFDYTGAVWHLNGTAVTLSDYGITPTGTAVEGDVIVVRYAATNAVYEVNGIDEECPANPNLQHVTSIVRKDCVGVLVFDPPRYLFAVTAEACTHYGWPSTGMPAGTYNIILDHGAYDGGTGEDGTYQFTTTQIVPVGGGVRHTVIGTSHAPYEKAKVVAGKFQTYGADRVTTIETNIATTEGEDGTNLGTTTCKDPQYKVGDYIDFSQKQAYGSGRWSTCFARQVLNSEEAILTFVPATIWSRPAATGVEGFLHTIDPELVKCLGKVKKRYALNISDGYGYEDVEDKVTLLTMLDVFGQKNNNISEGPVNSAGEVTRTVANSLWKDVRTTNAQRIKYYNGTARYWWLASTNPSYADNVRIVYSSGALIYYSAYYSHGVVPVLHII